MKSTHATTLHKIGTAAACIAVFALGLGCASTPPCRTGDVAGATVTGGRTAGEAVATGAKTGAEGVKAAGRAVGGWVEGGSEKAGEEWSQGKADTKSEARKGSDKVNREADVPVCQN